MMAHIEKKNHLGTPEYVGKETAQYILKKWFSVLPESVLSWIIGFLIICISEAMPIKSVILRFMGSMWEPLFISMTGLGQQGINFVVWYISAMLICMAILYPLLRKHHGIMIYLVIPITSLCIFGFFFRNYGHPRGPSNWLGWTYKGVLRAFAELGIGCLLYYLSKKIRSYEYTRLGQWIITLTESVLYIVVIYFMYLTGASKYDYFIIVLLAIAVSLTFSGSGIDKNLFNNNIVLWLGRFSVPLYFSHYFWAKVLNYFVSVDAGITFRLSIYLVCSFATAIIVMQSANLIRKCGPRFFCKLVPLIVKKPPCIE